MKTPTKQHERAVRVLRRTGHTDRLIAKKLGLPLATVTSIRR
jgi:hypothetical protein